MSSTPDQHAEWWTRAEVAAYLSVSADTISAYARRDQMPAPTYFGRSPMWRPRLVIDWHATRPGQGNRTPRKQG